jgi:hypothetical protein
VGTIAGSGELIMRGSVAFSIVGAAGTLVDFDFGRCALVESIEGIADCWERSLASSASISAMRSSVEGCWTRCDSGRCGEICESIV